MTIEKALTDYVENSKLFEKPQPCEPAWLTEDRNPSSYRIELEKQLTKIIDEKLNILLTMGAGSGSSCSISNYIYSLGMRASQVGVNQALSELDSWFNRENVDAYHAVVALGPQIKMPITVNDKITLYPAGQFPYSCLNLLSDLHIGQDGNSHFYSNNGSILKIPAIIAWEEVQLPRVHGDDEPRSREIRWGTVETMAAAFEIMEDAIRMVSIINRMHYYIHRRTSGLREHEPFSSVGMSQRGSKSDAFFADWTTNHGLDIQPVSNTENYQEVFDNVWQKWEQCDEKLKSKIRLAIDRWSQSQHRGSDEDKAIEMRIALEALLIPKNRTRSYQR